MSPRKNPESLTMFLAIFLGILTVAGAIGISVMILEESSED